ncbi:MAG: hypothetical protein CM15mP58_18950 [Burkholderiaceae bacterium]|nr:MAG: hypothetical protein CM15mP58_18950 [Burkholderiaceae bacterium]
MSVPLAFRDYNYAKRSMATTARTFAIRSFKYLKEKLKILLEEVRDLFGFIKGEKNIIINYLHAREIIERLADGSLDIGFSGYDLLMESEINIQKKVIVKKKYDFGEATLVVAIPDDWIDVQTMPDLEEIAFEFKEKKKNRLRIATKYPNLTREFMFSRGVTQFKLVKSLGATEIYPFTGSSEIITDITSTGATLKANKLRILKDGIILKSQACLMTPKKNKEVELLKVF